MLLPIRTNILPRRTPYANYALIAVNVFIFLIMYAQQAGGQAGGQWANQFELIPARPRLWQFLTYAFLHANLWHILGNMYFLYLFGNNVNDKLGNLSYTCFYLAGAVFSGVGHALVNSGSQIPTLGASGAVAAVTGAYLVLFPQTLITVLYWLFFIGTIELPALYFIAIKMIFIDNVMVRYAHVAYDAHLAGYAFGALAILGMLAVGLVEGSNFDLLAMVKRWHRRRKYRDSLTGGYDPFSPTAGAKPVKSRTVHNEVQEQKQEEISKLRNGIGKRISERNLSAAADMYLSLISVDSEQILPHQHLLDIANQLTSDNKPDESARAYEQFLNHYRTYEYAEQVELMLGVLYSRYLNKPNEAIQHLEIAAQRLTDSGQLKMCREELAHLKARH